MSVRGNRSLVGEHSDSLDNRDQEGVCERMDAIDECIPLEKKTKAREAAVKDEFAMSVTRERVDDRACWKRLYGNQ